jgi:hypothetical protein
MEGAGMNYLRYDPAENRENLVILRIILVILGLLLIILVFSAFSGSNCEGKKSHENVKRVKFLT